jgi:hypothetical protein
MKKAKPMKEKINHEVYLTWNLCQHPIGESKTNRNPKYYCKYIENKHKENIFISE